MLVANLTGATQLSAARATTCARLESGAVSCWGSNSFGQLGLSIDQPIWDEGRHPGAEPVALGKESAKRVDVGTDNVCAVLETGKGNFDVAIAHPYGAGFECFFGDMWFGANRTAAHVLLEPTDSSEPLRPR